MDTQPLIMWVTKELNRLLQFDVGDDYVKNILKIETENEIKEFISSLLDMSIASNQLFLDTLLTKMQKPSHFQDVTYYKKPEILPEVKSSKKKPTPSSNNDNASAQAAVTKSAKQSNFSLTNQTNSASTKTYNRRACECQAVKHKLVGNCLKCGRIVCEQEGSGPCYFCGNLVGTRDEMEKIARESKAGKLLKAELTGRTWKGGFELINQSLAELKLIDSTAQTASEQSSSADQLKKAVEHKNKLIEYDRSSAKRTQVIDDESDYFNTNSKWLSNTQRNLLEQKEGELRDKRFGSKLDKTFTIDFAGRKIVDEQKNVDFQSYSKDIEKILQESQHGYNVNSSAVESISFTPTFVEEPTKKISNAIKKPETLSKISQIRLQDQDLQRMRDDGMCLSMHQPWASLLVWGIKKDEGRSWYTAYRGRLWIHAASKTPSEVDVKEVETFYKCYYGNQQIKCPSSYPTSCLLGYVDLVDCLPQEEYKANHPNGESDSDFVFICSNPRELVVKIPMPGQHKLFKLDKNEHSIAKKTSVIERTEDL